MRIMTSLMLTFFALLASCGRSHQPEMPVDSSMRQSARAADLALSLDRPEEAIAKYEAALARARVRDDTRAIGDYGYNLAVAQMAANHPRQALATVRTTRAELAYRREASFPALDLAEAVACYRIGEKRESDQIAARVEARSASTAAARATFLRGLIANETNDPVGLDRAIARLAPGGAPDQQADLAELSARRDIGQGAFAAAIAEAERAADLRRDGLDYRGMARALSVAADAEVHAGNTAEAAALYLRAGQSAAAQGNQEMARRSLHRAMDLTKDDKLHEAASRTLTELKESSD